MKEVEGGRRPTTGRSGTKGEISRQICLESEQMLETECSIRSVGKERMIFLFHSTILQGDYHFVEGFVDFERRSNNDPPNVEQRYLEVVVSRVSWRARERILQDLDKAATCHQDSLLTVILLWNAVAVCRVAPRMVQVSDSGAVIVLFVSSWIDRKTMEFLLLIANAFFYVHPFKRMSRITCSSFFGMTSHHVHINSYDQNTPIRDQQLRWALIDIVHSPCSAVGQARYFSFISLSLSISGS